MTLNTGPKAPDGQIYVCTACGKTSHFLHGPGIVRGWDVSCMMNAQLVHADLIDYDKNGYAIRVRERLH